MDAGGAALAGGGAALAGGGGGAGVALGREGATSGVEGGVASAGRDGAGMLGGRVLCPGLWATLIDLRATAVATCDADGLPAGR